jgi:hypothetical protein
VFSYFGNSGGVGSYALGNANGEPLRRIKISKSYVDTLMQEWSLERHVCRVFLGKCTISNMNVPPLELVRTEVSRGNPRPQTHQLDSLRLNAQLAGANARMETPDGNGPTREEKVESSRRGSHPLPLARSDE